MSDQCGDIVWRESHKFEVVVEEVIIETTRLKICLYIPGWSGSKPSKHYSVLMLM